MFLADGHCDTITTAMKKNERLLKNTCHIDLKRLSNFDSPIQTFAIWLEKDFLKNAYDSTQKAIMFFKNEISQNCDIMTLAKSYEDIQLNINEKKISGILGIEGEEALEGDIHKFYDFYNEGVRILTLVWNYENELGFGAFTGEKKGLKAFGREVVGEAEKLNFIIDVSHLNMAGFWDVCENYNKPFTASHSNSYTICKNARNLTDEQIKEIAKRKGIIGINLYSHFLNESGKASITDIIKHIDYIMNIAGEDYVALGCDFDGMDNLPEGFEDICDLKKINEKLSEIYTPKIAQKIMGLNLLEFYKRVL